MKNRGGIPYAISFDTKEMPGKVVGVRVQLDTMIIGTDDKVRVDLSDHPLYEKLEQYVLHNPSEARLKGKQG